MLNFKSQKCTLLYCLVETNSPYTNKYMVTVNGFHLFDVLKVPRNRSQGLDNPCDDNRGTSHAIIKQKLFCTKGTTVTSLHLKGKSLT